MMWYFSAYFLLVGCIDSKIEASFGLSIHWFIIAGAKLDVLQSFIWRGFLPLVKIINPNDSELLDQVSPGFSVLWLHSPCLSQLWFSPTLYVVFLIDFSDYRIIVWYCDRESCMGSNGGDFGAFFSESHGYFYRSDSEWRISYIPMEQTLTHSSCKWQDKWFKCRSRCRLIVVWVNTAVQHDPYFNFTYGCCYKKFPSSWKYRHSAAEGGGWACFSRKICQTCAVGSL